MRIMQIGHSHDDYLALFHKRHKKKNTYAERIQAYLEDYYWASHTLTPALSRMGHETFLCIPAEITSQRLWCEEHGLPWHAEAPFLACLEQIAWFQPDVLYVGIPAMYHDLFLDYLPYRPKLVVGWHATITRSHMYFSNYDLMLSSHEECLLMSKERGAHNVAYFYPGFPVELKDSFPPEKHTDLCFSGYWAISHLRRNAFLTQLAERLPDLPINCAYHLGFYDDGPECPESVQRYNRGAVWGRSMLRAFAASRITMNGFATINAGPQNLSPNMRQMEAMGVGSLMLTERSDNLSAFFTEDKDLITFGSTDELIEKTLYYTQHEEERRRIAEHGQATCLRNYNMEVRARAFMDRIEGILENNRLSIETLMRTLRALSASAQENPGLLRDPDIQHCVRLALDEVIYLLSIRKPDDALPLLALLESLPLANCKHLNFCRALRCMYQGENEAAKKYLQQELAAYPENDPARQCLSALTLPYGIWPGAEYISRKA